MKSSPPTLILRLPRCAVWLLLAALSVLFAGLLTWVRLPAALLLGPMAAAILIENAGAGIRVPKLLFSFAQGVIGCMIARVLTPDIMQSFLHQWPLFLGTGILIVVMSCLLGWGISKFRILPETTAIWGLLPGAASAMMIMAEAYGADSRLVAFMQYVRVIIVAVLASLVARFWVHAPVTIAITPVIWFSPIHGLAFSETLVLVAGGVVLGPLSRIPAGTILLPLFVGAALQANGIIAIELPRWLLAASYLLVGWNVGLRFTRKALAYATRALPQMILSIFVLVLFCGAVAFAQVKFLNIDPLTAYLATSPGGADSVAIIAASTKVNVGFVMAQQIVRFMLVLMIGPILSRFFSDRIPKAPQNPPTKSHRP